MNKLEHAFDFAGFSFPKYVWAKGPYYTAPTPNASGRGFYLDDAGAPGLRWEYADEVARLNHQGWFTDNEGWGDTIRGIVLRLPKGRGFLAGWTLGAGMASSVGYEVYRDATEAAYAADSIAERAAEDEREYQRALDAEEESEE